MEDPFAGLADRYNATGNILRQVVRHELVDRGLSEHLPGPPARIVDVGGGAGQQAIPLSRKGHEVTILDPSPKMLAEARRRLAREDVDVRRRVRLVEGSGRARLGETFDAVSRRSDVSGGPAPSPPCYVPAASSPSWPRTPLLSKAVTTTRSPRCGPTGTAGDSGW